MLFDTENLQELRAMMIRFKKRGKEIAKRQENEVQPRDGENFVGF